MDLVNILIVWGVDLLFLLSALSHLTWLVSKVSALDCEIILTGTLFLEGLWRQVIREHSFKEDLGCCGKFLEALSSREFFKLNSQSLPFVLLVYCLPLPLLSFPSLFLLSFSILSYFLSFFYKDSVSSRPKPPMVCTSVQEAYLVEWPRPSSLKGVSPW